MRDMQLQFLGVGTALKILFSEQELTKADLQRTEVMVRSLLLLRFQLTRVLLLC